jgi:hypothetical protein
MRKGTGQSWRVAIDSPEGLHLLLFVRDSLWLDSAGPDLPGPVAWDVPDLSAQLDPAERAAARRAWPDWWRTSLASYLGYRDTAVDRERGIGVMRWLVEGPGHGTAPPESLQAATRAALEPFRQWWCPPWVGELPPVRGPGPGGRLPPGVQGDLAALTLRAHTEQDVVRRLEAELGRRAKPFDFVLQVIGVAGPPVLAQDAQRAAVSSELVRAGAGYADWLYRTLRPLA